MKDVTPIIEQNATMIVDEPNKSTLLDRDKKLVRGLNKTIVVDLTYAQRLITGHIYTAEASLSEVQVRIDVVEPKKCL